MSKTIRSLSLWALLLVSVCGCTTRHPDSQCPNQVWYISQHGDDNQDGNSPRHAWKSIERVNAHQAFKPGDKILFRRGDTWNTQQTLMPLGNGSVGAPITIGSWGRGPKPRIHATGSGMDAVRLRGQSHWTIEDIEVRSDDGNGIAVDMANDCVVEGITIQDVDAFLCSPSLGQREFNHCGIRVGNHVSSIYAPQMTRLLDVIIQRCVVDSCATGIMISGKRFDATDPHAPNVSRNVTIADCIARNLRGDGIVIHCCANALITHCLCFNACCHNADDQCTAGIWTWNVRNGLVTGCESYGHLTPGCDRNPFDSDYRSVNVTFHDNFGHDCFGASMLVCAPRITNDSTEIYDNIFRNCGFENDRQPGFIWFYDCDQPQQRSLHHNTFIGTPRAMYGSTAARTAWCDVHHNTFLTSGVVRRRGSVMGWQPHDNTLGVADDDTEVCMEDNLSADFGRMEPQQMSLVQYRRSYRRSLRQGTAWRYGPRTMSLRDKYIDYCNRLEVYGRCKAQRQTSVDDALESLPRHVVAYVNSYHPGYAPSDEAGDAIRAALTARGDSVWVSYIDAKRHPEGAASRAKEVAHCIAAGCTDAVVVSDDDAVKHLLLPYLKDSDMPVVFCGVNWDCSQYGLPCSNVTGVLEVLPLKSMLTNLLPYTGNSHRLGILSENTLSEYNNTLLLDTLYRNAGWQPTYRLTDTFDEWKEALLQLSQCCDAIYLPTNGAIDGWNEEEALTTLTQTLSIPTVTCDAFMMPYCVIGYTKMAAEQGERAAKLLFDIWQRPPGDSLPPVQANSRMQLWTNSRLADAIGFDISPWQEATDIQLKVIK